MKRILQIAALAFIVTVGGSWRNTASAQPGGDISYQDFYDELSPYGEWVDYPEYGYVWVPAEDPDFMPYRTRGHWVWSQEFEWLWVSDYSWGWAPFHYGRWFYDPFYGWMWMPGYEWSPAWVAWRHGGDYYGWAPLRPGINISINFSIGSYNPPIDYWCFTPRRYITSPYVYNHCLDRSRNVTIINNTTIINNYSHRNNIFITGPRRGDAERYTGRINPVRFRDASSAGRANFRNNEVSVYRPRVRQGENRQFTPRRFERYDNSGRQNRGNVVRGNDNNPRNGNNLPTRRDRTDNPRFERRNSGSNPGQGRSDDRIERPRNRMERRTEQQPGNNDNRDRNMDRRRNIFDRGNNNQPGNNDRRPGRSFERPGRPQVTPQQRDNRNEQRRNTFERRNSNPPSRQVERPRQQQPRQFENRRPSNENRGQRPDRSNNNERKRR